jgi:chromosome segregation protein
VSAAREDQVRLAREAAALDSRIGVLAGTTDQLQADIVEAEAAVEATRQEQSALRDLAIIRNRAAALRVELAERRDQLSECQSAAERLYRDSEARKRRLAAIAEEMEVWERREAEAGRHLAELDMRRESVACEIEALAARPNEIAAQREALTYEIETAEARRKRAADALATGENRLAGADRALKGEEAKLVGDREERVRAEAALEQVRHGLETVKQRVYERLECRFDQVLELIELDPGQEFPPREEVEAKLDRLLRERESIGPVNLRAEQEAAELERQIAGMEAERADLVAAIGRLRHGISSLNREGRERLLASFEAVNQHFSELFVRLFGGGRAHLRLTEADDPLEAGLEIMASPPGKRLQVLSLLSGGEQALTALALLFAVFLTNPAPICVLDEVDAPLDDANVDRFCTLVEELAHSLSTRFLLITHHRMTMARVDRLFGVTMAERGVSQLVSVDLEAAESLRESA